MVSIWNVTPGWNRLTMLANYENVFLTPFGLNLLPSQQLPTQS